MAIRFNVVCHGDSITAGTGASDAATTSYPPLLAAHLETEDAGHWEVDREGHSGFTLVELESNFASHVGAQLSPASYKNIVIIHGGTNDIGDEEATGQDVIDTLSTYCATAEAAGWEVWVCTITSRHLPALQGEIDIVNAWLRLNFASVAAVLIDFAADPVLDDGTDASVYPDGVHPNDLGYTAMAARVMTDSAARREELATEFAADAVRLHSEAIQYAVFMRDLLSGAVEATSLTESQGEDGDLVLTWE